jgi:Tfp pilus assembly protein PilN
LRLNLLPEDQRQASSRALYFPTIALASLILITTVALLAYGSYEQRRYLETLQLQIRQITPKANRASRLEQQISETRARADAIDRFRLRSKEDMDALNETTRVLAPPSFLTSMSMARQSVEMSGHADQAAGFLKLLDGTGKFQNSTFTMPIQRDATGENFSLRAQRKGVTTQ